MRSITLLIVILLSGVTLTSAQDRGQGGINFQAISVKECPPQGFKMVVFQHTSNPSQHIIKLYKTDIKEYVTATRRTILHNTTNYTILSDILKTSHATSADGYCNRTGQPIIGEAVYEISYTHPGHVVTDGETSVLHNGSVSYTNLNVNQLLDIYRIYSIQQGDIPSMCESFACWDGSTGTSGTSGTGSGALTLDQLEQLQQDAYDDSPNKPGVSNGSGSSTVNGNTQSVNAVKPSKTVSKVKKKNLKKKNN